MGKKSLSLGKRIITTLGSKIDSNIADNRAIGGNASHFISFNRELLYMFAFYFLRVLFANLMLTSF